MWAFFIVRKGQSDGPENVGQLWYTSASGLLTLRRSECHRPSGGMGPCLNDFKRELANSTNVASSGELCKGLRLVDDLYLESEGNVP